MTFAKFVEKVALQDEKESQGSESKKKNDDTVSWAKICRKAADQCLTGGKNGILAMTIPCKTARAVCFAEWD